MCLVVVHGVLPNNDRNISNELGSVGAPYQSQVLWTGDGCHQKLELPKIWRRSVVLK